LFCRFSHFGKVSILPADKTLTDIYPACQSRKAKCTPSNLSQQLNQPRRILFCVFGRFLPIRRQFWHHGRQPEERKGSF
jgi:hypothetical protein